MDAHSMIMTYRPMSQMLRLFVVPEVEKRVAAGTVAADQLPFQVHQFRFLQGDGQNVIEINDDVKIAARVPITRAVKPGEPLTLLDVNPDECFLEPPTINGKPAGFFLCRSLFLNFITMFDFTPGAPPDPSGAPYEPRPMRYPLTAMAHAERLATAMKPIDKFRQLADASWPPGPGHYPDVMWRVHEESDILRKLEFLDVVEAAHNDEYWKHRRAFWMETNFFGDRIQYVTKAIDEYLGGDYVASIYVIVPHFEGVVRDYLDAAAVPHRYRFESCVKDLKTLVLSRKVLMFPRPVLDQIFNFIENGTFLTETGNVNDPAKEVTRHGIAHGVFKNFENREIALKYLILLDALGYVLLHDKLLAGTL
jgi:hypothetical protein